MYRQRLYFGGHGDNRVIYSFNCLIIALFSYEVKLKKGPVEYTV
jgi:hypothetical protein